MAFTLDVPVTAFLVVFVSAALAVLARRRFEAWLRSFPGVEGDA